MRRPNWYGPLYTDKLNSAGLVASCQLALLWQSIFMPKLLSNLNTSHYIQEKCLRQPSSFHVRLSFLCRSHYAVQEKYMLNIFPVLCFDADKFTSFADVLLASPTFVERTFASCCFLKCTSCHHQLITQAKRHYRLIIPNVETTARIRKDVHKYSKLYARRFASAISYPNAFSKFPGSTLTQCI